VPPDGDLLRLEQALREHVSVHDCAVISRESGPSRAEVVAYVVPAGSYASAPLSTYLASVLPDVRPPDAYVPLATLPLTPEGLPDEHALCQDVLIDETLIGRWEDALRAEPGLGEVAVASQDYAPSLPPLHLSDLLPGWKPAREGQEELSDVVAAPTNLGRDDRPMRRSLSVGQDLRRSLDFPTTLPRALRRTVDRAPYQGIVYVQEDGAEHFQSYVELEEQASRIYAGLLAAGLKPGDKVLFQLEHNQDFIPAFWGCVLGGIIPVPLSIPPTYKEHNGTIARIHNAWQLLGRPIVLTSRELAPGVGSLAGLLNEDDFRVAEVDVLKACEPDRGWHASEPDDVVIMLLTSGSTGKPKAVQQCHRSVLARSAATAQMNGFSERDVSLNWFPLDHVGGIVMFHVRDVFLGCRQVHAPTQAIARHPLKWLDLIDRHRATITWAPNFAYGLINAQAQDVARRSWDLSSMRFILNAGESIVAKTVRKFLQLLTPHGLPPTAMRPAWGMSETSSAVTYSDLFTLATTRDEDPFVEVGAPIPEFAVRIVDANNQVVEEGKIGSLQVRGPTVTSGYFQNPELNREVFTEDGWFTTGDLGTLREGRLTITGRQKDVIIINGVNFYSHEIEAVVEEVAGVEVSYTAACAVREPGFNTDSLAVFFHSPLADGATLLPLLKEIRGRVVRSIGVNPTFLVPVDRHEIPKTEIGKIQRTQLRRRFEEGEFDGVLKQIDIRAGNSNTLPNWFYRKIWRPRDVSRASAPPAGGTTLVLLDAAGLGELVCAELNRLGHSYIAAEPGPVFARIGPGRYRVRPGEAADYCRLLEAADAAGAPLRHVLHLGNYGPRDRDVGSLADLELALEHGTYSVLGLIGALRRAPDAERGVRLLIVSSLTQPIIPGEPVFYERAPVSGLVRTVCQEMPQVDATHLDFGPADLAADTARVLGELGRRGDREVAYRGGRRLIPRLERVDLTGQPPAEPPFRRGGVYLVSGGLGGVGVQVARFLLERHGVRLLLIGRRPLPDPGEPEARMQGQDAQAERIQAYRALADLGDVRYEAADVADIAALSRAVEAATAHWGRPLDGIVHLAGNYEDQMLGEQNRDGFAATLRPKVAGAWALHQLLRDRPEAIFIHFSSVLSYFGGAMVGAYAAANRFLEAFAAHQRDAHGLRSFCYAWSLWEDTGMSRGHGGGQALRAKGIMSLSADQGVKSLAAALDRGQPGLLIGLDGAAPAIRRELESAASRARQLCAYYTAPSGPPPTARLAALALRDRFGTPSHCEFWAIAQMPRTASGDIDRPALIDVGRRARHGGAEYVAPRTESERRIAELWREVLGVSQVGLHDNFFELGGHSLLATRVISRLRDAFGVELTLRSLFESSTVAKLADHIQTVLPAGGTVVLPSLEPVARRADLPLSFAQQRLWFFDQLEPGNPVYNIPSAVRLRGPLDVGSLERSVGEVLLRHEAVRTAFPAVDGRPVQVVSPAGPPRLPVIDVGNAPESERETEARRLATEDARRPFDLARDHLLRPSLLRLGSEDHVLVLTMHHIAADGWSLGILFREIAALYEGLTSSRPTALPALPIQYADFAVWQRQWLEGGELERQLVYWRKKLVGIPAALDLPVDFARPPIQGFRGAVRPVTLPHSLAEAARALGQEEGTTQFMTMLGAFQTLLAAYSGQDDICVGSPISGRTRTETELLIGFFANTLVLRTSLAGNPTFRHLLGRVRETALGAYAHQDVPFEKLVEALRPPRDPSRNPLFQVNFRVQNAPPPYLRLPGLESSPLDVDPGVARFDLALDLWTVPNGFGGYLEYNTNLYQAATADRIAADFESLLAALLARPDTPLEGLSAFTNLRREPSRSAATGGVNIRGARRRAMNFASQGSDPVARDSAKPGGVS
jgi:surfactin family lipopeptide synthetase A